MTVLLLRNARQSLPLEKSLTLVAGVVVGWPVQESLVPDARAGLTPSQIVEQKLVALRCQELSYFRARNDDGSGNGRSEQNGSSRPIDAEFEGRQRDKLIALELAAIKTEGQGKGSTS
jgi:hypothetical protein